MKETIKPRATKASNTEDLRCEGKPMFAVVNCDTGNVVGTFHSWNNGQMTFSNPNKISIANALKTTTVADC